jgi:hypothetical protein
MLNKPHYVKMLEITEKGVKIQIPFNFVQESKNTRLLKKASKFQCLFTLLKNNIIYPFSTSCTGMCTIATFQFWYVFYLNLIS